MQIQDYLQSDDIEAVKLGAILLQHTYPREEWVSILFRYSGYSWTWRIEENEIVITEMRGLYSQLKQGHNHIYSITNFDLNILTDAIKQYYDGKDNKNAGE